MKQLTPKEIGQVNGGGFLAGIAIGIAIGSLAKKAYNNYQQSKKEREEAAQKAATECVNNPNCA
ncbi:hypothetical protein [Thalassotalea eurytherma]|uniref:Class IIb bacteriocin, lactobin A/cerein 7B family n=1 Tax=Thalassotalea eurytherma TaxID=1144278 RepID=A0ABQ6H1E1_9GAMM|nr:hypothetical protein [Thalassotalea eurytherma]GLX81704.1 hypothetical protein theurythT_11560 [Thalassotalea eurytherma]